MHNETVTFAKMLIAKAEEVSGYECKMTPRKVIIDLQAVLDAQVKDAMYDIDDALSDVYVRFCIEKQIRPFTQLLTSILNKKGLSIKDGNGNFKPAGPKLEELIGSSNDDDLQGEEILVNDMSQIVAIDIGPGSDLHIACIDIEDTMGTECRDIFECVVAGETEGSIADFTGLSRDQVMRRRRKIEDFLERLEYTLAPVNYRLGAVMWFMGQRYNFPAKKDTLRKDNCSTANTWTDHRSTRYVDPVTVDNTPLRPIGELRTTTDLIFEDGTGKLDIKIDDRNTTPGVVTERCKKLPGFCMNGHTIKDCSRKSKSAVGSSDYDFFKYCDEQYDLTVSTKLHLL